MKIKILVYIGLLFFAAMSCSPGGIAKVDKPGSPNLISDKGDGEEYELIIIDPGYQRWYTTYGKPINYYSPAHYKQWNSRYVTQWNALVGRQGVRNSLDYPFENRIDYDAHIDYGLQLEHELYWYFRYIEHLYGNRYDFGVRGRNVI